MKNPLHGMTKAAATPGTRNQYVKRFALATLLATVICIMPAMFSRGVKASAPAVSTPCGFPEVFAFPNNNVPQGTPVTIFVTESNLTAKTNPFVIGTTVVGPNGTSIVATDSRIVQLNASGGNTSFAITFTTSGATEPGTYTVTSQSYQGGTLPAIAGDFCSAAETTFTIACNGNGCFQGNNLGE